jgi:hypothetical protein
MAYIFSGILNWLRSLFFAKHLEVTIVGLQVCLCLSPSAPVHVMQYELELICLG